MSKQLIIDYACRSEIGLKAENADAADARIPPVDLLTSKGVAAVIADGMSSSEGGKEASQVCVTGFLNDYFSSPESWTVKTSGAKILSAINRWLYGQGQSKYDSAKGMVTTLSAMVIKSTTAYLFHVGDSRIYLYRDGSLEQLTRDHRVWISKDREFLSRAMGIDPHVDIDYKALGIDTGDLFVFTTDGVHEFLTDKQLKQLIDDHGANLKDTANRVVSASLEKGSTDNVTCQLLLVESLPSEDANDIQHKIDELPFPPNLAPNITIDGYKILRELHASKRSEVYLAVDLETDQKVTLKTPSVNYRDDPEFLDGFLHEEWVGRRINNPHVLKVYEPKRRRFLYHITEYVEGQSLRQWIDDNPTTDLQRTRDYIQQLVDGLRAFHRLEMVHQDLKPDNILIDPNGTLKLIDFGSTRIAGVEEINSTIDRSFPQGTVNYTAPEYLQGEKGSALSDIFSLGVIAYELLTGKLPHGEAESPRPAHKLHYQSARAYNPSIPFWVDGALKKATHPNPKKRYHLLSEFVHDLSNPNQKLAEKPESPLLEKNPVAFWKTVSAVLSVTVFVLLILLAR